MDKYKDNYERQPSFETGKRFWVDNFRDCFGADVNLSNIRYVDLETYRNHLKEKPTKNGTVRTAASVNREMPCLHHIFAKAVEWEMVERNPFDKGKTLLFKENNKQFRYLEQEEIDRLLASCTNDHTKEIIIAVLNTGIRRQEVLGLKWEQTRNGFIYLNKIKTGEVR